MGGERQGSRGDEFFNIFTGVSGAGAPARLPPKAAKIHPATYFGRVYDAGWRRQAGGDARPTKNSLHPIALRGTGPPLDLVQLLHYINFMLSQCPNKAAKILQFR